MLFTLTPPFILNSLMGSIPMHPSLEILRLLRERLILFQFRRKFHADMAVFAFRLSLVRLAQSQD